jgi:hypothetical protein
MPDSRHRAWVFSALGLTAGLLLLALTVWVWARGPDDHSAHTAAEFLHRTGPATAWTGGRLFVYGGAPHRYPDVDFVFGDAALADPETGEIELLGAPPMDPLIGATATVAGGHAVVVGRRCAEIDVDVDEDEGDDGCRPGTYAVADYSLNERSWQDVDIPSDLEDIDDGLTRVLGATSDGRVVMLLGGRHDPEVARPHEFWTYAPVDATWEQLPPVGADVRGECLAGDTVVVASHAHLKLLSLAEDGAAWEQIDLATVERGSQVACGDDFLAVLDRASGGLATHPVGADLSGADWVVDPRAPAVHSYADPIWTGEELLWINDATGRAAAYDPSTQEWRRVDTGFGEVDLWDPVWTGTELVSWHGASRGSGAGPISVSL